MADLFTSLDCMGACWIKEGRKRGNGYGDLFFFFYSEVPVTDKPNGVAT